MLGNEKKEKLVLQRNKNVKNIREEVQCMTNIKTIRIGRVSAEKET